jgi:serine/threonine protein kinase/Tfp pilus assembly protein PilF
MANPTAVCETSLGNFTVELYTDKMPITAGNFIKLAKSGFYDGLHFHRVIKGFMSEPAPHQVIAGKYELCRELARGGMGSVWVARDHALDRDVAIKLILAEGGEQLGLRERFTREARALAALSSRHIVHVFDFGVDGASPFLVTELLHGEDLGTRLKRRSRLSLPEVASIGAQIAKALTVAHERGLVHRDLKPANVFLTQSDGEEIVKVLDFGIAKSLDAPAASGDLTRTGMVVGTPQYMSPEQFRGAQRVDHRSDLWSLGAVLYRCLIGEPAFLGDSLGDLVLAISSEPLPVPSRICTGLPAAVDEFFERAFERDPTRRFQSAREMADALAAIAGGAPSRAAAVSDAALQASVPTVATPVRETRSSDGSVPTVPVSSREPRPSEPTPLSLPDRPSVAVLPFTNMSGDPEQDYFADGTVEDLVTALSRLRWLFVISRQSTQVYKGRSIDVRAVGRDLGVRYVLQGSVRKAGQRVRITAQLVETATGAQLWAERYDGALADVFELQDRITESVLGALEPSVQQAEIERARRKPLDNPDAYDLLLRALPFTQGHSPATTNQALPLLEQALSLHPGYALAHAYKAWCLEQRFLRGGFDAADRTEAVRHAREAITAGSDDATALALGGFVLGILGGDPDGAVTALDQAIAVNPSSAMAYNFSSVIRVFRGEDEIAVAHAQRAIRLSPLDPLRAAAWMSIAYAHFWRGSYAEAVTAAEKGALANPRFPVAQTILAASRARLGQPDQARAAAARLLELDPSFTLAGQERAMALVGVHPDRVEAFLGALRDAGIPG